MTPHTPNICRIQLYSKFRLIILIAVILFLGLCLLYTLGPYDVFNQKPRNIKNVERTVLQNQRTALQNQRTALQNQKYVTSKVKNWILTKGSDKPRTNVFSNRKEAYLDLLDTFTEVTRHLNLPWMLYGHSLLRSWFHHGMYFDQSLEILMDNRDKLKIKEGFKLLSDFVGKRTASGLKFQRKLIVDKSGETILGVYLDVKFFTYNVSYTWELSTKTTFLSKYIFPITKRPFENRLLLAPQNTFEVLFNYFGPEFRVCRTKTDSAQSCSNSLQKLPFVYRSLSKKGGVTETLKMGNKTLTTWWGRDMPQNGISNPYSLRKLVISETNTVINDRLTQSSDLTALRTHDSLSPTDKKIILQLLDALIRVMESINAPWFLNGGSILGSWRHHTIIPWDDDIDIILHSKYRKPLMRALRKLDKVTNGNFRVKEMGVSKFWSPKNSYFRIKNGEYKWPFIDIFFYLNDSTHLWHEEAYFADVIYNLKDIFPLKKRPFENRLLYTPYDTLTFLKTTYGDIDDCWSKFYSHKREGFGGIWSHSSTSCQNLNQDIPLVYRSNSTFGGVVEKLMIGDVVVNTWWGKDEPQSDTFGLETQIPVFRFSWTGIVFISFLIIVSIILSRKLVFMLCSKLSYTLDWLTG